MRIQLAARRANGTAVIDIGNRFKVPDQPISARNNHIELRGKS